MANKKPRSVIDGLAQFLASTSNLPAQSVANPDETTLDLEREAAELMLKEAAEFRHRYNSVGVEAYLHPNRKPRADKRFLVNVMRQVDSHNKVVLRQEALEASRRRSKQHGRMRAFSDESTQKETSTITDLDYKDRVNHRTSSKDTGINSRRDLSAKRNSRNRRRSISPSTTYAESDNDVQQRSSSTKPRGRGQTDESRMDRYFSKDYDPRLDIADSISANGLIPDFGDSLEYASNVTSTVGRTGKEAISSDEDSLRSYKRSKKDKKRKRKKERKEKRKHKHRKRYDTDDDDTEDSEDYKNGDSNDNNSNKDGDEQKKKRKRHRRHRRTSSTDYSSSSDSFSKPSQKPAKTVNAPVREWDQAKLAGSWDPSTYFIQHPQ